MADKKLSPDEIVFAHNVPGGDAQLRAQGYGEALDDYLASVSRGITWAPLDMSGTPSTPVSSSLDHAGRRVAIRELPPDADIPPYTEWSHDDLVTECADRELSTEGSDEDLAIRLLEDDDATEETQSHSYSSMKKADLQEECRSRSLDDSGTVDELRARLREDDSTRGE